MSEPCYILCQRLEDGSHEMILPREYVERQGRKNLLKLHELAKEREQENDAGD